MTPFYFLIPVIAWIAFAKFWLKHHFSVKELAAQAVLSVFAIGLLFMTSDLVQTGSTKLVNGEVTAMRPVKKSCPVGWVSFPDDHCTNYYTRMVKSGEVCSTDSKGNRSCTDTYTTEYWHVYPWERRYFVDSDIPETFEIDRVDAQGVNTPPRFAQVMKGDPVTVERFYRNYIRAAADTLFRNEKVEPLKITYPRVFDYYRVDRVIYDGVQADTAVRTEWNRTISDLNRDVRKTGANVILVLTSQPEAYAERLAFTWRGHNINDVVVTLGVDADGQRVSWADVRSWSGESLVNVRIKDAITGLGRVSPAEINEAIKAAVSESYKLRDMKEFEYLKHDIPTPAITLIIAFLLVFVATPGLTYIFATRVDLR